MHYEIEIKASAIRELEHLPKIIARRVSRAIDSLSSNPLPPGCQKLKGEEGLYRIRVGDYRIVYMINSGRLLIPVMRVAHRKDVYR